MIYFWSRMCAYKNDVGSLERTIIMYAYNHRFRPLNT